jgi:polyphosphate kinase
MELTNEDLEILNSKIGLKHLLANKRINLQKVLTATRHELKLREIQAELVKLQLWVIANNKRVLVLFHGGDSSEKSTIIRKILSHNNPRHFRVEVNLPYSGQEDDGGYYFKKFIEKLPQAGEMVFWDRSWYNRALFEPILGICSEEQYEQFMDQVNNFDKMLVDSEITLIKFYFTVSPEEQADRYKELHKSPLTRWKTEHWIKDTKKFWKQYKKLKDAMFEKTNTPHAPWIEIDEETRELELIAAAEHLLESIPYQKNK